jgi:serine phosphatase RsbU (regulator of sigma subunit)
MSKAYLIGQSGALEGQRIELSDGETRIGREWGEVLIPDVRVSRLHARITREDDSFYIADLDSRNKTYVNGRRVDLPVKLRDGARINIGRVCDLLFRSARSDADREPEVVLDDDASVESTYAMSPVTLGSDANAVPFATSPEARLAAIIEISRHLGLTLALEAVLPRVLQGLFNNFTQADRGFIVLKLADGQLDTRWKLVRGPQGEHDYRISRRIVQRVMDTKQALLLTDAGQLPDTSDSVASAHIRSVICAPLVDSAGEALGVLQLDTRDRRKAFRPDDLDVLASVAVHTSIAVQNASFHERTMQQEKHDLELRLDLELANAVQRAMLPQTRPELAGYNFFDHYSPMKLVGGDYYDYVHLPDGRLAVIVADIDGHGIAAAMMMAKLSSEAKFCLVAENSPADAMRQLNERICAMNIGRFFTALMVVLNPASHEVTILNAGHWPPIWRRGDGTITEPGGERAGMMIGICSGQTYEPTTIQLGPGEALTMYTDGIIDAMTPGDGPEKQFFTRERIYQHVRIAAGDLKQIGKTLIQDVEQFIGSGPQTDDMCLVCLGRT